MTRKLGVFLLWIGLFMVSSVEAVVPLRGWGGPVYPRVKRPDVCKSALGVSARRPVTGKINIAPRGLLILAEFTDCSFAPTNTRQAFDSMANALSYTYNGSMGSCRDYFMAQSAGKYKPQFDVVGPVRLPHTVDYYGADVNGDTDRYLADFVIDAAKAADSLGVDFSLYDNDHDGAIDFVYIIYAGYGQADGGPTSTIWPHNWDLMSALFYHYTNQSKYYFKSEQDYYIPKHDGKELVDYACSSELKFSTSQRTGVGVFCHEFSHVLGLPDYYPEDNTYLKNTPGSWSIMGYGCYINDGKTPCNFSAYDKYYLGWLTPQLLSATQDVSLPADGVTSMMVTRDGKMPAKGATTPDTVYYIENRQYIGWDTFYPGHGMLVWRVIFDQTAWDDNTPNGQTARYFLVTADGQPPYNTCRGGAERESQPFPGTNLVTSLSLFGRYTIQAITETPDGVIQFHFEDHGTPTDTSHTAGQSVAKKYLRLGQGVPYIIRGGKTYNMLGQLLSTDTY